MIPDELLPAAFAVMQSPKRYALLLGSGISKDAGIPTGGEIAEDKIKQIANGLEGKKPSDPESWYKKHYGKKPTFSRLFDGSVTAEDREASLKEYFIVDGEIPQPTDAHKVIARLVKQGLISIIITTNFDRLLERALEEEGIQPVVITEDSYLSKMSVVSDQCRIIKVNGDYPDTPLKITPIDLNKYSKNLKDYLDRIFSEYGIIECGWSASDDSRIVKILLNDRVRRHAFFWCYTHKKKIPKNILKKLDLNTIKISSANEFFKELEVRIDILQKYDRKESMTIATAIRKVSDAFRDPRPDLVLSDLINRETEKVCQEIASGYNSTEIDSEIDFKVLLQDIFKEYERLTGPLAAMAAMIAYYDSGENASLITDSIEQLLNIPIEYSFRELSFLNSNDLTKSEFNEVLKKLRYYPAILVIYCSGVAAEKKGHLETRDKILRDPQIKISEEVFGGIIPYLDIVDVFVAVPEIICENSEQKDKITSAERKPYEIYLKKKIYSIIQTIIPNQIAYDQAFIQFILSPARKKWDEI